MTRAWPILAVLVPGGCVLWLGLWLLQRWRARKERVSAAWCVDQERREFGTGVDGVAWQWPVNKVLNEQAWRQTAQLRKRA